MKKTYKAPKYKAIDLTGEAMMIAGSDTDTYDGLQKSLGSTVGEDEYVKSSSRMNLWDDEW